MTKKRTRKPKTKRVNGLANGATRKTAKRSNSSRGSGRGSRTADLPTAKFDSTTASSSTPKVEKRLRKVEVNRTIRAIVECDGNLSMAAKRLGIHRTTLYKRAEAYPEIDEAIDLAKETLIDVAEKGLNSKVREGNLAAIIFLLKTQGRLRGYSQKIINELEGTIGTRIEVEHEDNWYGNGSPETE